ncbi:MAG: HEAT repeat domain-containing protein [Acidimicrobiales bacterium]|nr:HEAT repeat domain-containing protein [Acidimicrobiales bacterium]
MDHDAPPGAALRRRRAALAGHLGDAAAARAALGDPEPAVRATALRALARSHGLRPGDLTTALADPAPGVRRRALSVLAGSGGAPLRDAAVAAVVPLLADADATVAEVAAWALGELPAVDDATDRTRSAALARVATSHPDPLCREAAVAAIASIGHPDAIETVLAALTDKPAVRRRAVVALAAFDDPRAEAALEAALQDRDRQVRETAEELLAVPLGDPEDDPDRP